MEKKQEINCNVHSCEHCNCSKDVCELREIEVKKQCGCDNPCNCNETICGSFKEKKEDRE